MFKMTDPFSYYKSGTLKNSDNGTVIGTFLAKYQVTYDEDVSLSSGTANVGEPANKRVYIISCTQRVTGYNEDGLKHNLGSPGNPADPECLYNNYPVMLENEVTLKTNSPEATSRLVNYSPKTVNSQVQSARNSSNAASQSTATDYNSTVGSSQAQSNSFSTSVGLQGDALAMGVGHDTSKTTSSDQNSSMGASSGNSSSGDTSDSASMSIKDWGAYAAINPNTNAPNWVFGQEYPWDIFASRAADEPDDVPVQNSNNPNQYKALVPTYMTDRLYSTAYQPGNPTLTTPPSQLSMFGYDFVMKAQWVVEIPNGDDDTVKISHAFSGTTATHTFSDNQLSVYIDKNSTAYALTNGDSLDVNLGLGTMALEPLGPHNVIGFIPSNFVRTPTPVTTVGASNPGFYIYSKANTLLIHDVTQYAQNNYPVDSGFSPTPAGLNAKLAPGFPLTFRVLFKVTDVNSDYTLHMKHWKFAPPDIQLNIVINSDTSNPLAKTLSALEGEGAEDNLLDLTLRNQNYASVNYSDALVLGLNSIDVTLTAIGNEPAYYSIRAIAIEPS